MTSMELLRERLRIGKGHWAVVVPAGCRFNPIDLDRREEHYDVLRLRGEPDGMIVHEDGGVVSVDDLAQAIDAKAESVHKADGHRLRVILNEFHLLSLEDQCLALKVSRAAQEATPYGIGCQFVVCGRWNYYRMRGHYHQSESVSPALQSKDVFYSVCLSVAEVIGRLQEAGVVSASPSRMDEIAAQLIVEATAGDSDICAHILDRLRENPRKWHTHLETVLIESREAPDLHEVVKQRVSSLDGESARLLCAVLRHQIAETSYDNIEAEELKVWGLVREVRRRGAYVTWSIASPVLDRLLRTCGHSDAIQIPSCERGAALSWSRVSVTGEAYRLIAAIEDFLRNVVVLQHCAQYTDWKGPIGSISADPRYTGSDISEVTMIRAVVREVLAEMGVSVPKEAELSPAKEDFIADPDNPPRASGAKSQKTTLLETALDWQRRQNNSFLLHLSGESLVQFLTFGDLQSVLKNRKAGMCEPGGYFDKAQLSTHLDQLKAIRDAVAHNQPLSMRTLYHLQGIYDYLMHSVTSKATVMGAKPSHLSFAG